MWTLASRGYIEVVGSHDHGSEQIVLIVEDETLVRVLANDILSDAGYRVLEARDGLEAVVILETHENICALFTDIRMPNLDGVALVELVTKRWPNIGVVMTSGDSQPPEGTTFIRKPYTADAVVEAIEKVVRAAEA